MAEKNHETRTALEEAAYNKLNRTVGVGTIVRIVGPVVDVKFDGQVPGIRGNVDLDRLLSAASGGDLAGLFARTPLEEAAQAGAEALGGGPLTQFERLCDNALTAYLSQARRVPFGEHPLIGYLYAKENELTTIRIILTGRLAGLDAETIRERLRESYV